MKAFKENISKEEQTKMINEAVWKITEDTVRHLAHNISKIHVNSQAVDSDVYIQNWLLETDRETYDIVKQMIADKTNEYVVPDVSVTCQNDSCHKIYPINMDFNPAEFLSKSKNRNVQSRT